MTKVLRIETCEIQRIENGPWEKALNVNDGMGPLIDMDGHLIPIPVWNGHPLVEQMMTVREDR